MIYNNKEDIKGKIVRFTNYDFKARITGFIGDTIFLLHVIHVSGCATEYYKVGDNVIWPITNKSAFIICDNDEV